MRLDWRSTDTLRPLSSGLRSLDTSSASQNDTIPAHTEPPPRDAADYSIGLPPTPLASRESNLASTSRLSHDSLLGNSNARPTSSSTIRKTTSVLVAETGYRSRASVTPSVLQHELPKDDTASAKPALVSAGIEDQQTNAAVSELKDNHAAPSAPRLEPSHATPQENRSLMNAEELHPGIGGQVVYELDGGIRLAGGPPDELDIDSRLSSFAGNLTLPPPYQRY
ncbi:hypothetical protein C8Q76DRAFT_859606 [Earliella scabrosa]|nr:hypothetical protein C8Q76DRAFT_859606 [Earliella scabrosa]